MYIKIFKRLLDLVFSVSALVVLSPLLLILSAIGAFAMKGNPFFVQPRPSKKGKDGKEKIFYLIKLRTMSNACDANGEPLPDEQRIGKYGMWLRSTSLDELPSLVNIVMAHLSIVGPRPFLVRDMIFMTEEQRRRHTVRPVSLSDAMQPDYARLQVSRTIHSVIKLISFGKKTCS